MESNNDRISKLQEKVNNNKDIQELFYIKELSYIYQLPTKNNSTLVNLRKYIINNEKLNVLVEDIYNEYAVRRSNFFFKLQ